SAYTGQTLVSIARLQLNKKTYNEAMQVLRKMELTSEYKSNYGFAINKLLVSFYHIGDFVETQTYAKLVKEHDKSSEEDIALAHLYSGKAYTATNKPAEALKEFNLAALKSNTVTGAEARYRVAEQQLKSKDYDK